MDERSTEVLIQFDNSPYRVYVNGGVSEYIKLYPLLKPPGLPVLLVTYLLPYLKESYTRALKFSRKITENYTLV